MKRILLVTLGAGLGCAAASYTVSSSATTPTPVAGTFACLRQQAESLGYHQRSLDVEEHRLAVQRQDYSVHRADVHFRRLVDVLEFEVRAGSAGGSAITMAAKTFAEYMSQQGQTFEQEATSDSVRAAGQAMLAACAPGAS